MSVDEVAAAVERTVPSYSGRSGDWDGVLESVWAAEPPRPRARWIAPAVMACAAAAALVLFWPTGASHERILERALAAVADGPVIHLELQTGTAEFYDLRRRETRREPIVDEIWFDAERGIHDVTRVDGRVVEDVLLPPGRAELDRRFIGLGEAYRQALRERAASVGDREEIGGRPVYWISFEIRYPDVGIPTYVGRHSVAIDAETYEPRLWRDDGIERPILLWETLPAGRGDFSAARTIDGTTSERWYGITRVGTVSPERARGVLGAPPLWLGPEFGGRRLAFIREVKYESGEPSKPLDASDRLPGLELCYGSGEACAVSISQATARHPMLGRFSSHADPPPDSMLVADDGRHALVNRGGLYLTLHAEGGREALIAIAEALKPIP